MRRLPTGLSKIPAGRSYWSGGPTVAELTLAKAIDKAMQQQGDQSGGKGHSAPGIGHDRPRSVPDQPGRRAGALFRRDGNAGGRSLCRAPGRVESGPLGSLEHCVDRFPEAARQFLDCEPEQVRWGRRLERPGVMELITPDAVIEKPQGRPGAPLSFPVQYQRIPVQL